MIGVSITPSAGTSRSGPGEALFCSGVTAAVPRFPHPLKKNKTKQTLDGDSLGDAVRRQRVPASERLRGC